MTFKIGDKVRANGREGVLVRYNEEADRLAVAVTERGGGTNTIEGHISTTTLSLVEPQPELFELPVEDDPAKGGPEGDEDEGDE